MRWAYLGRVRYADALALQKRLVSERKVGDGEDTLLLLEHPPVITLGVRGRDSNVLAAREWLAEHGVEVHRVERGGDVTYHGPGQLVGYPIMNLRNYRQDVGWFVASIATTLIRALAERGIRGEYQSSTPGVWVGDEKIAAIGARIEQWISYHGFALNVNPDMSHWQWIVPCGITDRGVTSIEQLSGAPVTVSDMIGPIVRCFGDVFSVDLRHAGPSELSR